MSFIESVIKTHVLSSLSHKNFQFIISELFRKSRALENLLKETSEKLLLFDQAYGIAIKHLL